MDVLIPALKESRSGLRTRSANMCIIDFFLIFSLTKAFTGALLKPVPVFSASKSWLHLIRLRSSLIHCHSNMKTCLVFRVQRLKQIGKVIVPHGIAALAGVGLGTCLLNGPFIVQCEVKHRGKNRLVGQTEHDTKKPEVDFDWKQFFQLLWPDIYSLALAILVGSFSSFC